MADDDDEPIVIEPRETKQARGGRARAEQPTLEQALVRADDASKLSATVVFNNTTRMLLAKRRANIIIFPQADKEREDWRSRPQQSDPPEIRLLFEFQQVAREAATLDDPAEKLRIRCKALTEMRSVLADIAREVGEGGEQARKILTDNRKHQLEQEKLERDRGVMSPDEIRALARADGA